MMMVAVVVVVAMATAMGAPLTLPSSSVGLGEKISITSHPYSLNGGGVFVGTVNGQSVWFWCVDIDNTVSLPANYIGNVVELDNTWTNGNNAYVTKGTKSNSSYRIAGYTGSNNVFYSSFTNEQRYQIAADLISKTNVWTNGSIGTNDQAYQDAAWAILDLIGGSNVTLGSKAAGYLATAVKEVMTSPGKSLMYDQFAVVSGSAQANGTLTNCPTYQTFLVGLNPGAEVPEPGTYALFGGGLVGLAMLKRRMKKA